MKQPGRIVDRFDVYSIVGLWACRTPSVDRLVVGNAVLICCMLLLPYQLHVLCTVDDMFPIDISFIFVKLEQSSKTVYVRKCCLLSINYISRYSNR